MEETLRDLMERVIPVGTERRFAHLTLQEDPFFHRLRPEMHREAVDFGLTAGRDAADQAMERYGQEPEAMAAVLRISVVRSEEQSQAGPMVHFSEYREKPPQITLYRRSMAEANQLIQDHQLEGLLGFADVEPMHLAHELYHHLEAKKLISGASRFRLESFRLGPLRFRTGLPSLREIAADRFAMGVLKLRVPPKATQLITIYAHNPDYAWTFLTRLRSLPE
jgi:hypothetical protein